MTPDPDTIFTVRLDTNEMIERERFAAFLKAIEDEIREQRFAGPNAVLIVGPARRGSIEITLAIVQTVASVAGVVLALPPFFDWLKKRAADKTPAPNPFASSLGEIMGLDGTTRADFIYKQTIVSISREEVPFAQMIALDPIEARSETAFGELDGSVDEDPEDDPARVEDEDQDWAPTLEARDPPPRDAGGGPHGQLAGLSLAGEFETVERSDGTSELRFVPRDQVLAPYFVVTSNAYEAEPLGLVQYQVIGNVTLEGDGPGTIEILSIAPPDDAFLTLRT